VRERFGFFRAASTGVVPKEGADFMGRRLFILSGMMLILACRPAHAQGQGAKNPPAGDPAAPLPAVLPPDDLALDPNEAPKKPAKKKKGGQLVPPPALGDAEVRQAQAGGDPKASAPPATTPPVAAPVQQPDAAGEGSPVSGPTAGEGGSDAGGGFLSPDRLPLGKQEVVVSVDVQSPANLNFEQPAIVRIIVKNSGSSDALGVVVRDELPDGLAYVGSQPEAQLVGGSHLIWRFNTLPAGAERAILLKVRPTRVGAFDHAATVSFQAGSKATSRVLRPRLKVEVVQSPTEGKVLKNKTAEFRIAVTNTGDGPARNVIVRAQLSPGLRHDTSERNEENSFELPIQQLNPGQREDLDPLTVDAIQGGPQWCRVRATGAEVVFNKDEAEVVRKVVVVEPKLTLALAGPTERFTDTVAPYTITLENKGTAPATNVRVLATLGVSGRLVRVPPDAKYDMASRRLRWVIPQIDAGSRPRTLAFEVRMGGISSYEVNVEALGDNGISLKDRKFTDIKGMPDVDLVVREKRRVVDVDGTTTFQVRLRNYGTKEATKLEVSAELSKNMEVLETAGGPEGESRGFDEGTRVVFPIIPRLGPGKEMVLAIKVKVTKPKPQIGTCRVKVSHDDLPEPLEDMARVRISESGRTVVTGP
jgi:uncharacterized repeat protein (TIGR01451 family)